MKGQATTDEQRATIVRLHGEGMSRNAIARTVGVAGSTVTKVCADEGLDFDRSRTEAATRAAATDLEAARLRLAEKLVDVAERMLDSLDQPYLVYNFGGKDNTYEEHLLRSAPFDVRRTAVVSAGIAFDKLTRILERSQGGLEQAEGVLDQLAAGFAAAAKQLRADDVTASDDGE